MISQLSNKTMVVFFVLTQLGINLSTTAAVINVDSSHCSQTQTINTEKMVGALSTEYSIDKEAHQDLLLDETIESLYSISQDILSNLPTAQVAVPSDNAPVLLPLSQEAQSVIIPLQPSVPNTVIVSQDSIDDEANTNGDTVRDRNHDRQHDSVLVF